MATKLIAVTGATGAQGGAVVRELLKDGSFKVRGITRNVESAKSQALRSQGVEMVSANYDDNATLENAFRGCYGAYLVTNFWEHENPEKEFQQGKNLADSAKAAGVQHVVWSTLEDTRDFQDGIPMVNEKYKVPHFDSKGGISKYMDTIDLPMITHLYTCYFIGNLTGMLKATLGDDGVYKIMMPMGNNKLAVVAVEDIGKMGAAVFKKGIKGKVGVASEHLTVAELVNILSNVTGKKFEYVDPPIEQFKAATNAEWANMFSFLARHVKEMLELRDMDKVKALITPITIEQWAKDNKEKLLS